MLRLFTEAARYAAASAVAYVLDTGLLLILTRYAGWYYLLAATVSFLAGATVAYVLSVRFVFRAHRLRNRKLEFTSFVLLGLAGVAINLLVMFVTVGRLGMHLLYAKAVAACFTFVANFALRRQLLFRTGAALA
ncbi:MAG TPA: GtrA family protein [Steroidobacteraceae bacterium]|jgi:putative flippase GtrA|nr:GtrA family protein [Steroidobacteraceae bacterium]